MRLDLAVFLILLVQPDTAVFMWYKSGVPFWLASIYLIAFTSAETVPIFMGIGWIKKFTASRIIPKISFLKKLMDKWDSSQEKTTEWLKKSGALMIFLASCAPIVPIIPTASLAAAKLLEIKYGLILMLIGGAVRSMLSIVIVYKGLSFFFP